MCWRKRNLLLFTCAGILAGCAQTFAWGIPGVTKPFDPANYWTADTISWPDSAPSVYTLRDIAKNGGNIIDYQNLKPNMVKELKAVAELSKRLEELLTELKNIARLDGQTDILQNYLDTVTRGETIIKDAAESGMFLADGSEASTMQAGAKGLDEKYRSLDAAYQRAFVNAKNEMQAYDGRAAVINEAMKRMDKAEGLVAAVQSQTETGVIEAAEIKARNWLLAQRVALITLHHRAENDEVIRAEITIRKKLEMAFADPYHPSVYEAIYKKTAVNGMPDFQ